MLAWLFARSSGSQFLMRVEDLDAQRVRPGVEAEQLADLAAIGLDWDGPVVRQSKRVALYEDALARLDAAELLYPCYCTRAEIREAASAPHGPLPGGGYPGTCRELSAAQRAERERSGRPPALRLLAGAAEVSFTDRLAGTATGVVDDFVVRRNDGAFAYNLAVVVDDAEQGIEEVVRGADLFDSAPRQIFLARCLGLPTNGYAHVPLVLGPDGTRLAKRHGAVTLADRLGLGETVEDVVRWMASSLGLPADVSSADELVDGFDPDALSKEPSAYGIDQG